MYICEDVQSCIGHINNMKRICTRRKIFLKYILSYLKFITQIPLKAMAETSADSVGTDSP